MDNEYEVLTPPLLDRLLEQNKGKDLSQGYSLVSGLKESIRRDLEYLFNARFCRISPPQKYKNLDDSLINFGLPDLSVINMSSMESRKAFCRDIEVSIKRFEPRITSVKVTVPDVVDNENPEISFHVTAILNVNPLQDRVIFNSSLDPISKTVNVSEPL